MEARDDAGAPGAVGAHNPDEPGSTPGPATNPRGIQWRVKRSNRGANGGTSPLPPGKQWRPGTQSYRERYRRHRQAWAKYEKLCARDGYAKVTRERLLDYVAELNLNTEAAEVAAMALLLRAKVAADDDPTMSWTTALNRVLNELEEAEKARIDPAVGVVVPASA